MSVTQLLNYTYDDYKVWEGEWELIDGHGSCTCQDAPEDSQ